MDTVVGMRWLVAAAALLLVACGDDDAATATQPATTQPGTTQPPTAAPAQASTSAPTTAPAPTTVMSAAATVTVTTPITVPSAVVPQGFEQVAATVTAGDGTVCELCLWLAATGDQRALGLMYITELGGPDGMVFRYDSPTTAAFWMKNTIMPLSIAFYDQDGAYLDAFDMAPCTADPCPSYPPPANFVDAIEVPQGMLDELGMTPGSVLAVSDLPCD
jgi:uncharacterized protein